MSATRGLTNSVTGAPVSGASDYRPARNLLINGGFDSDLSGWVDAGGNGSAAWVAGTLEITEGSTSREERRQVVAVVAGGTYRVFATLGGAAPIVYLGSSPAGADYGNIMATGTRDVVATTATLSVRCQTVNALGSGGVATFDNMRVIRVA